MRDVNYGWLLRYLHANGASMFFIVVIFILLEAFITVLIYIQDNTFVCRCYHLLIMILTAFLGYVLPWGQMSFGVLLLLQILFLLFLFSAKTSLFVVGRLFY